MPSPITRWTRWVESLVGQPLPAGHLSPATTAFPRTQMGRRPRPNLLEPHRRFTCVTACLLAGPPSGPLRRRLRRLGDLRRRSDCYRLERPSCRTGVAPAEDSVLFTAHYVPFFVSCVPFFVFPRFGSRRADPGERSSESGVRRAVFGGRSSESGVRRAEFGERSSESGFRRANSGERISESGSRRAEFGERSSESGFRRANSGERISESGSRRADPGERIPESEFRTPYSVLRIPNGLTPSSPTHSLTDVQRNSPAAAPGGWLAGWE